MMQRLIINKKNIGKMLQKVSVTPSPHASPTQRKAIPIPALKAKIDTHPVAIPNSYFFD